LSIATFKTQDTDDIVKTILSNFDNNGSTGLQHDEFKPFFTGMLDHFHNSSGWDMRMTDDQFEAMWKEVSKDGLIDDDTLYTIVEQI